MYNGGGERCPLFIKQHRKRMIIKDPYYGIKAVSSSSLKYIDPKDGGSPQKFKAFLEGTLSEERKSHLIRGTLIHMSMLEPEKFIIADVMKPAAALGDIADTFLIQSMELNDENILNTIRAFNWQNNWKDETVVKKFKESGAMEYVEYMLKNMESGKIAMDKSTGTTVDACKTSLTMNPQTNYILKDIDEDPRYLCFNEKEVVWEDTFFGAKLRIKAKLDKLIVDLEERKFTIVDVKTTGKPISLFHKSFEEYRYPRQMKFYYGAAKEIMKSLGYGDFTLDKVYIAAVETSDFHTSQLFDVTPYLKHSNGEIRDLLKRIAHHTNTGDWINSMERIEGNGVIVLSPEDPKVKSKQNV